MRKVSLALRGQLSAPSSSRFYHVGPIASANSGESGGLDKLEGTIFNVKPEDKRLTTVASKTLSGMPLMAVHFLGV